MATEVGPRGVVFLGSAVVRHQPAFDIRREGVSGGGMSPHLPRVWINLGGRVPGTAQMAKFFLLRFFLHFRQIFAQNGVLVPQMKTPLKLGLGGVFDLGGSYISIF